MPPIPVLVALADATRCQIISILREGPQPVHAIAAHFDISRPAISRHLRVLKQAALIREDKKGRENLYRVHLNALKPVQDWLTTLRPDQILPATPKLPTVATPDQAAAAPAATTAPEAEPKERPARPVKAAPPVSQLGFEF